VGRRRWRWTPATRRTPDTRANCRRSGTAAWASCHSTRPSPPKPMRWPRRPVGTPVTPVPEPPPGDEALRRSLQALLERLATIWRRITNRADLQETLDVLTA